MAEKTGIEWCDSTVNFWWGCQKVSPGCQNCYAETMSARFFDENIWGPNSRRREIKSAKKTLLKLSKASSEKMLTTDRTTVFVQSMSDFFEDHPDAEEYRKEAIPLLEHCDSLQILLLTKRPENVTDMWGRHSKGFFNSHIHLGVSVENQKYADERIPIMFDASKNPISVRWISAEPLLGSLDLGQYLATEMIGPDQWSRILDWVIVGGESGPGARRMRAEWADGVIQQCKESHTSVFFKQWGMFNEFGHNMRSKKWDGYDRFYGDELKEFPW